MGFNVFAVRDRVDRESTPRENCVCDKKKKRERGEKKVERNETKRNRVDIAIFTDRVHRFDEFRAAADEFLFPSVLLPEQERSVNIEVTFPLPVK